MSRVVFFVLLLARVGGAADAVAPKLDPPAAPAAPAPDPTARKLPPTIAVCRDVAARKCWTAPTADGCGGVDAVYRVVIAEPGRSDANDALAACRADIDAAAR